MLIFFNGNVVRIIILARHDIIEGCIFLKIVCLRVYYIMYEGIFVVLSKCDTSICNLL